MTKPTVSLNALLEDAGQVELDGALFTVRGLRGRDYQALQRMQKTGSDDVGELYRIAGACVPGLDEEQVLDLTVSQMQAILAIASGGIVEVEESAPKALEGKEAAPA